MPLFTPSPVDMIRVDQGMLQSYTGTPARGRPASGVTITGWLLDQTTNEGVESGMPIRFPTDWAAFDSYCWLATIGTTASNTVRMSLGIYSAASTATSLTAVVTPTVNCSVTGGTTGRVERYSLATATAVPSSSLAILVQIFRDASNAADNYAADICLLGVDLVRAS